MNRAPKLETLRVLLSFYSNSYEYSIDWSQKQAFLQLRVTSFHSLKMLMLINEMTFIAKTHLLAPIAMFFVLFRFCNYDRKLIFYCCKSNSFWSELYSSTQECFDLSAWPPYSYPFQSVDGSLLNNRKSSTNLQFKSWPWSFRFFTCFKKVFIFLVLPIFVMGNHRIIKIISVEYITRIMKKRMTKSRPNFNQVY